MNVEIKEYNASMYLDILNFRKQALKEGNDSLKIEKFNPDVLHGKIWCSYIKNELASISVAESSHYTGDPEISVRICRYHILKKFRHSHCGFRMLPYQIAWAKRKYKILYWTHDINNRALNALYQHRRKMLDAESKPFFEAEWYKKIKLDRRLLFKVDPNSNFLQYVYYMNLDDSDYVWNPKKNIVWISHNGQII